MDTIQQIAHDSGLYDSNQINVNIGGTILQMDSSDLLETVCRSNPVGRYSGIDAFGMNLHKESIIIDS
jgi:hypothetical protein